MAHKKYTYRNGKRYGPYIYENRRVGDKVITKYIGKGERNLLNIFIYTFITIACLVIIYLIGFKLTGYPILGVSSFLVGNGTCEGCTITGTVEFENVHSDNTDSGLISYWQFTSDARDSKGLFNLSVNGAAKEHERYLFDGVNDYLNVSCGFECLGTPDNSSCSQFAEATTCEEYSYHNFQCNSTYVCSGTPNSNCTVYLSAEDCGANSNGSLKGHYNGCSWNNVEECTGNLTCSLRGSQSDCEGLGCTWTDTGYGTACSGTPNTNCSSFNSNPSTCALYTECSYTDYRCEGVALTPSCSIFPGSISCGRENNCSWDWSSCSDVGGGLTCTAQNQSLGCSLLGGCSVNVTSGFPLAGVANWSIFGWVKTNASSGSIISVGDTGSASLRLSIFGTGVLETIYTYGSTKILSSTSSINDNLWHFIGLSYNGTYLSMFMDNSSRSVLSDSINIACKAVTIGHRPLFTNFSGSIDEVKIYNRSLNSTEVSNLYNSGLFQQCANYTSAFYDLGVKKYFRNASWIYEGTKPNLLLRVTMDDVNSSGNPYDTSLYSNALKVYGTANQISSGKIGKAYRFNGTDGYIESSSNLAITGNSSWTISFWVSTNTTNDQTNSNMVSIGPAFYVNKVLSIGEGSNTSGIYFNLWGGANYQVGSDNFYNNWTHIAVTYNGSAIKFYSNSINRNNNTLSLDITSNPVRIGGRSGGYSGQYFDGKIDEVIIFNKELTPVEIRTLYLNSSNISVIGFQNITLQVRSASDTSNPATYSAWSTVLLNPVLSKFSISADRYVQFKTIFASNDSRVSPVLSFINISYLDDDTTAPLVNITSPLNGTSYVSSVTFNVSLDEGGEVRLSLNGGASNYTMGTTDNINFNYTNASIAAGNYLVNIYANDSFGNKNFTESVNFSVVVDSTAPIVTIVSPTSTTYTSNSYNINITLNEAGYCKYSLNSGSSNLTLTAGNSNKEFTATVSSVSNGDYTLRAYCNDSAGNNNYTRSVSFSVSVSSSVVSSGGGGGGGGGGGFVNTTKIVGVFAQGATYIVSNEQMSVGYRQVVKKNESMKFYVKDVSHLLVVNNLFNETVSITISSSPMQFNLSLGKQVEVDVDSDGSKDVIVGFWSIKDKNAEIFIRTISSQSGGTIAISNGTSTVTPTKKFDFHKYVGKELAVVLAVGVLLLAFTIYRVVRRKILEKRWEHSRQQFKWRPVGEVKT